MAKVHFDEIDIVKGIAILFVLWHHSFIKFPIYMLDIPWCEYAMAIHGTFYLNVFFFGVWLFVCSLKTEDIRREFHEESKQIADTIFLL